MGKETSLKILAVDLSGIFSQNWLATGGNELSLAFQRTIQAVARHREGFDRVAVAVDSGMSYRRGLWPSYKMNRTDRGAPYYEQLRRTADRLAKDGCTVLWAPSYSTIDDAAGADFKAEADDVLASICAWAKEDGHTVRILSADKDLLQLVDDAASIDLVKPDGKVLTEPDVLALYGIPARKIPLLLGLAGDKSDNFKPYEGVGEKRAADLIKSYAPEEFQGVDAIWAHIDDAGQVVGDAIAKRLKEAGPEPGRKALAVATLVSDLEMDFSAILEEPIQQDPSENAEQPAAEDIAPAAAAASVKALAVVPEAPPAALAAVPASGVTALVAGLPYWANPGYLDTLWRVAKCFNAARCFPNVAGPEQVMVVAMIAYEANIGLATAMQHAYFVHGRLSWSATWFLMRIEQSGQMEQFDIVKLDDSCCQIKVKRKGRPARVVEWRMEESVRAGLVKPDGNHKKYPQEMNLARCIARASRQEFRAICGGMYVPEELGAELPEEAVIRDATQARGLLAEAGR